MRKITIEIEVTSLEYQLLETGKMDTPHPERVKRLLLNEAARNLRNLIGAVLNSPRDAPQLIHTMERDHTFTLDAIEQRAARKTKPKLKRKLCKECDNHNYCTFVARKCDAKMARIEITPDHPST